MRCELDPQKRADCFVGSRTLQLQRAPELRVKHLLVKWVGENVPPMKRAATTNHQIELRKIIQRVSIEIEASGAEDIETATLNKRLHASGVEFSPPT